MKKTIATAFAAASIGLGAGTLIARPDVQPGPEPVSADQKPHPCELDINAIHPAPIYFDKGIGSAHVQWREVATGKVHDMAVNCQASNLGQVWPNCKAKWREAFCK